MTAPTTGMERYPQDRLRRIMAESPSHAMRILADKELNKRADMAGRCAKCRCSARRRK